MPITAKDVEDQFETMVKNLEDATERNYAAPTREICCTLILGFARMHHGLLSLAESIAANKEN